MFQVRTRFPGHTQPDSWMRTLDILNPEASILSSVLRMKTSGQQNAKNYLHTYHHQRQQGNNGIWKYSYHYGYIFFKAPPPHPSGIYVSCFPFYIPQDPSIKYKDEWMTLVTKSRKWISWGTCHYIIVWGAWGHTLNLGNKCPLTAKHKWGVYSCST